MLKNRPQKNVNYKIFSIFCGRFPSEKAHALFAAKEVESFLENGIDTVLVVPKRLGRVKTNPKSYYKLKVDFKVVYLPTIDLFKVPFLGRLAFRVNFLFFSFFAFIYLLRKAKRNDIVYASEPFPLLLASMFFPKIVYEVHDYPEGAYWFYNLIFKRTWRVLVTNTWKLRKIRETFPITNNKAFFEPNAVDVTEFDISETKNTARKRLAIPPEAKVVVYTGHLYSWKGVDTLAAAAEKLPENHIVYFVGGTTVDCERFRKQYKKTKNIIITGHKPHDEIPMWQKAADVLILPNTGREDISKYYTSPMKLYEYMASGRPIVASDLPSIRAIARDNTVHYVEPDNPVELAAAIKNVLSKLDDNNNMTVNAKNLVNNHTWSKRADRILRQLTQ